VTEFAIVPRRRTGYLSSETSLARAARVVSVRIFSRERFDIRFLAAIHVLLLLAAIGLLLRACRDLALATQWLVAVLLVLVFTDVGYAASFNSFYPQSASLLFLLLALSCAAIGIRRGVLEGGPLRLAGVRGEGRWRRPAPWLALAFCAVSLWYYREIPGVQVRYVGPFHNVFAEVLPHSPDPPKDPDELQLDRGLLAYSGMNAYEPRAPIWNPAFGKCFFDKFGYRALGLFSLHHPLRLLDRPRRGAPAAFELRPEYVGTYAKSAGVPPRTKTTHFAIWSDLREKPRSRAVPSLLVFFGGNLAAVAWSFRRASTRGRLYLAFLIFLLLMAATELLACSVGDALLDLGRHLYVFGALCDVILIGDVAWLVQAFSDRHQARLAGVMGSA
jgi:hypothetical protein